MSAPRTRNGSGTVEWRDGVWQARINTANGKRPWFKIEGVPHADRAEAKRRANEMADEIKAAGGVIPDKKAPDSKETVAVFSERWLEERDKRGIASNKDSRGHIRNHVIESIGQLPIREVTSDDLREFVNDLDAKVAGDDIAWKTAANIWGTVSKMFGDTCASKMKALRVRRSNPTFDVAPPDKGDQRARAFLYPSELLQLASCTEIPIRWRRLYVLAVYTFTRAGELLALKWPDFDFAHGNVHVHQQMDRETDQLRETKTGITRRFSFEPTLQPLLAAMRTQCDGLGFVTGDAPVRELMASKLRMHLETAGIKRGDLFADDKTRAPITFHDLRATGLTWCAVRGDDALLIRFRAGHTDLKTTTRYVRAAEAIRGGFGQVFPELPSALLSSGAPALLSCLLSREASQGEANPTIPGTSIASPTGFEPGGADRDLPDSAATCTVTPSQMGPVTVGRSPAGQRQDSSPALAELRRQAAEAVAEGDDDRAAVLLGAIKALRVPGVVVPIGRGKR